MSPNAVLVLALIAGFLLWAGLIALDAVVFPWIRSRNRWAGLQAIKSSRKPSHPSLRWILGR